jgi:hypothetical protein
VNILTLPFGAFRFYLAKAFFDVGVFIGNNNAELVAAEAVGSFDIIKTAAESILFTNDYKSSSKKIILPNEDIVL